MRDIILEDVSGSCLSSSWSLIQIRRQLFLWVPSRTFPLGKLRLLLLCRLEEELMPIEFFFLWCASVVKSNLGHLREACYTSLVAPRQAPVVQVDFLIKQLGFGSLKLRL